MQVHSILLVLLCASLAASLPTPLPGNIFSAPVYPTIWFDTPNSETVWTCGDQVTIDFTIRNYKGHILEAQPKLFLYLHTYDDPHPKRRKFTEKYIEKVIVGGRAARNLDRSISRSGKFTWTVPTRLTTGYYYISQKLKYWTYDHSLRSGELETRVASHSQPFYIICNSQQESPWISWFTL
ncbi:hypothetical protein BKA69DRAFT_1062810 [Paraphysoderma sedebokerense]|nr:hypothetical protein BKA69DRAFT_1062810 [Paraphysoderma sedebokerense]